MATVTIVSLATIAAFISPEVKLAVFSATGFDPALLAAAPARADVELVDLDRLYTGD